MKKKRKKRLDLKPSLLGASKSLVVHSWVARTKIQGWYRNYHLKLSSTLPRSKLELAQIIEDVSALARFHYELKEFTLLLWERPEKRPFKKRWLMQFEIVYSGFEEHPEIKHASFDVSNRQMYSLKQEWAHSDSMELPPEPKQSFSEPDIMNMRVISSFTSPYDGMNGRKGPYDGMKKRAQRSSLFGSSSHGPSQPRERIQKPLWRLSLTKSWRYSVHYGPLDRDED